MLSEKRYVKAMAFICLVLLNDRVKDVYRTVWIVMITLCGCVGYFYCISAGQPSAGHTAAESAWDKKQFEEEGQPKR